MAKRKGTPPVFGKLTPQQAGSKGGKARMRNLTAEQISEIARKAGAANTPEQQSAKRRGKKTQ